MREKYENMNEGDLKDLKIDEQFMTTFCYSAQSNPSFKGSKATYMSSNNLNPFFSKVKNMWCDTKYHENKFFS